eukprot:gene4257-3079_t
MALLARALIHQPKHIFEPPFLLIPPALTCLPLY